MNVNKFGVINDLQRSLKLQIRLSRKSNDDIGRDCGSIKGGPEPIDHSYIVIPPILPIHPPQNRIRPALKRQMKMRHDLLVIFQNLNQFVIQITRLQTRKPYSEQS